jgi:opacity protein-like surface antigen
MSSLKTLAVAGVLALAASHMARAADLPPVPELEPPPLRGMPEEPATGFYMRASFGVAATSASDLRSTFGDGQTTAGLGMVEGPVSAGDPFILGLGAGWQFNNWFRADLTGEYRNAVGYQASSTYQSSYVGACLPGSGVFCGDEYTGSIKTGLVLANGYFDIGNWYGFTPYVGGGLGFAVYQTNAIKDTALPPNAGGFGFAANRTGTNFAWSLTGGVAYSILPNLKFDVAYRYVNMGAFQTGAISCNDHPDCDGEVQHFNMASNDILFGLRWTIGPLAEPAPVLRTRF